MRKWEAKHTKDIHINTSLHLKIVQFTHTHQQTFANVKKEMYALCVMLLFQILHLGSSHLFVDQHFYGIFVFGVKSIRTETLSIRVWSGFMTDADFKTCDLIELRAKVSARNNKPRFPRKFRPTWSFYALKCCKTLKTKTAPISQLFSSFLTIFQDCKHTLVSFHLFGVLVEISSTWLHQSL